MTIEGLSAARVRGRTLPDKLYGPLTVAPDARDEGSLRQHFERDGYVFLPSALDATVVNLARAEIMERLYDVGEVALPAMAGIATGRSLRRQKHRDLGAFWGSVSQGPALRQVTHGEPIRALMSQLMETQATAFDFVFLRAAPPGRWTDLHFDHGFFTRTTTRVVTAWIALGDIPLEDGPLMIVEGSHRMSDLTQPQLGFDVARDTDRKASFDDNPLDFAKARDTRLLSAHFRPGDIVVFSMLTLHGTLDNCTPSGHIRLSCDMRFQPATAERDPRYFGPHPTGTTGAGWGELNGAKPLDEPWHVR